ncbi:hypothetical protein V1509DRAFT_617698 [Lipomyces kononenkoae]
MYYSTIPRIATFLALLISLPAVRARPFIAAKSALGPVQLDSVTCFSPQQQRIQGHGGNTVDWENREDDEPDVQIGHNVECDPAIVINGPGLGAGDLDYIEELEEERQNWIADERHMREADVIIALEDEQLWNDFGENNHRNMQTYDEDLGYIDTIKQVIQGLICLLPEKAKHYTTCPKNTPRNQF